jgi:hypothetical protein
LEKALSELFLHLPAVTKPATIGILATTSAVIPARPTIFATAKTTIAAEAAFATSTTAIPASTTKTAATTKTSTAAAVATSTIESAATTAAFTIFHGAGFVNHDLPRTHSSSVHLLDSRLGLLVGSHLHKPKTLGASRHFVHDHFRAFDLPARSEKFLQLRVRRLERQAPNI